MLYKKEQLYQLIEDIKNLRLLIEFIDDNCQKKKQGGYSVSMHEEIENTIKTCWQEVEKYQFNTLRPEDHRNVCPF